MSGTVMIGSVPPCENYSGGLFLNGIIETGVIDVAGLVAVQAEVLTPLVPTQVTMRYPLKIILKTPEFHGPPENPTMAEVRAKEVARARGVEAMAKSVLKFCRIVRAENIWIVLEGQTLIRLAHALMALGDYPVRVQVMDPPGWQLTAGNLDPETLCEVLDLFDQVMGGATACAAASWAMAQAYRDRYGVRAIAVVPALPREPPCVPDRSTNGAARGARKIGFAGQPYARAEFDALMEAVAAEHADPLTPPVELHIFTNWDIEPPPGLGAQMINHGWVSQNDLLEQLCAMDLLYCGYWFDPAFAEESALCFPSKVTTYLASGRPTLFHGRSDSSPARFLRTGAAAFFCFRPDAASLRSAMREALTNDMARLERARNGRDLFHRHLSQPRLASAVEAVLRG